jgi:hypothetical protein
LFYFYFLFQSSLNGSCGGGCNLCCSGKMRRHEPLQIEVCELVVILQLEQLLQLGVRDNPATVGLVLKLLIARAVKNLAEAIAQLIGCTNDALISSTPFLASSPPRDWESLRRRQR